MHPCCLAVKARPQSFGLLLIFLALLLILSTVLGCRYNHSSHIGRTKKVVTPFGSLQPLQGGNRQMRWKEAVSVAADRSYFVQCGL